MWKDIFFKIIRNKNLNSIHILINKKNNLNNWIEGGERHRLGGWYLTFRFKFEVTTTLLIGDSGSNFLVIRVCIWKLKRAIQISLALLFFEKKKSHKGNKYENRHSHSNFFFFFCIIRVLFLFSIWKQKLK